MVDIQKDCSMSKDKPFFIYDNDGGFLFFRTRAERDAEAKKVIDGYLHDSWDESVESTVTGVVMHSAQQVGREERPDDEGLDEDGCDYSGEWWGDWAYKCGYKLLPLQGDASPLPSELIAQAAELVKLAGQAIDDSGVSESERNSAQFLMARHQVAKMSRDLSQLHSSAGLIEFGGK